MKGMIQKKLKHEFISFKKIYFEISNLHFIWFNSPKKSKQTTLEVFQNA